MDTVTGTVFVGRGNASGNFRYVAQVIADRIGLPGLSDGTLNLQVPRHYPITAVDAVITPQEYNHEDECIKLRRCRLRKTDGGGTSVRGVIVRPSQHEDPERPHYLRLEIMSQHHLRTALSLADNDEVIVEIEGEREKDDNWWNAQEADQAGAANAEQGH